VEYPFPQLQSGCIADISFGSFRLGDGRGGRTVQRQLEASVEKVRGGNHPRQDRETEWVGDSMDELLGEGFDWFCHTTVTRVSLEEIEGMALELGCFVLSAILLIYTALRSRDHWGVKAARARGSEVAYNSRHGSGPAGNAICPAGER
jgi:hypothetical protein